MATATSAVFLDALGTLVALEPPWVSLRPVLGPAVPDEQLISAVRAEMAYYKAHSHEGRDRRSLTELRERSARILSKELGVDVDAKTLVDSLRFEAYPDAPPALRKLRARGLRLVCVSNWDCSLHSVLDRCGLAVLLDGAVSSAQAGARKPDGAIFAPALELARCKPEQALHVGDSPEDLEAAQAAGIRALLIDRDGAGDIASLAEVEQRL